MKIETPHRIRPKEEIDHSQNCGVCMRCKGTLPQLHCPKCLSINARERGLFGHYECENGHCFTIADFPEVIEDIELHKKMIKKKYAPKLRRR